MSSSLYYKTILFTFMVLVLASCATKKSTVADKNKAQQNNVIDYAKRYLNTPYKYAARGPGSFDCSGYTSFVFAKFGYNLNPSSAGQARQGITIRRKDDLEIGDLVFFEGRSHNGRVGHVGIVSELGRKGDFEFIHASTTNGVIITTSEEPYYKERYLRGGRIIKDVPKIVEKQEQTEDAGDAIEENNYAKAQKQITYKETNDGFVSVNSTTGLPVNDKSAVSTEQTSKPVKNKKQDDKKKKDDSKIRQAAIRGSEESLVALATHISHKVKPGETLFSISQIHNCSVEQLKKWNPEIMNNTIQAGDVLDIYQ